MVAEPLMPYINITMALRDEKEKQKTRREEMGKFFYDLAKTTFAVMVLGNVVAMATAEEMGLASVGVLVFGGYLTFIFAYIANETLGN